jgi:hypothetical protein
VEETGSRTRRRGRNIIGGKKCGGGDVGNKIKKQETTKFIKTKET